MAAVDGLAAILLLAALLTVVGVCLLLWTSARQNAFPFVEPLLLAGGVVVLLPGVFLAQLFGRPWLFPATIAVASGSFLTVVLRYPTFDTLPAARVAGRDRVVDELSAGVIVVDRDGRIRDCNARAASHFVVSADSVLGAPLPDLLGADLAPEDVEATDGPVRLTTDRGTTLELTGSSISGRGDRSFGTLLLCTDVTDRRIREERLALLRRFVVDVVGTRMEEVAASASIEGDDSGADRRPDERAEQIWTTTTALTRLVASARDVERAIGRSDAGTMEPPDENDLRGTIRTVIEAVTDETEHSPSVDLPERRFRTSVPRPLFETTLRLLLEDARRHATDRVAITATTAGEPTIRVCDDRPTDTGASDGDRSDGREMPVTRLAVEQAGGSLSITEGTDGLRCIEIELPSPESGADRTAAPSHDRWGRPRDDELDGEPRTTDGARRSGEPDEGGDPDRRDGTTTGEDDP